LIVYYSVCCADKCHLTVIVKLVITFGENFLRETYCKIHLAASQGLESVGLLTNATHSEKD